MRGYFYLLFLFFWGCVQAKSKEFSIVDFFPQNRAENVDVNTEIWAVFSKDVDTKSVTTTTFYIRREGEVKSEEVDISIPNPQKVLLKPKKPLQPQSVYVVVIDGLKSVRGEIIKFEWIFKTGGFPSQQPPQQPISPPIKSVYPSPGSKVPSNTLIYIVFSEEIEPGTLDFSLFLKRTNEKIQGKLDLGKEIVIFTPDKLQENETYLGVVKKGLKGIKGTVLQSDFSWEFYTLPATLPDTVPPSIISTDPKDGERGVTTTAQIRIYFSEDIDLVSSSIKDENGNIVQHQTQYTSSLFLLTLLPSSPLSFGMRYTVSLVVRDKAGNTASFSLSFTTVSGGVGGGAVADTIPPQVVKILFDGVEIDTLNPPQSVTTTVLITAVFSEKITSAPGFYISSAVGIVPSSQNFNIEGTAISLQPISPLSENTRYWVIISDVRDSAGNELSNPITFSFTTIAPDSVVISSPSPNSYVKGVIPIEIRFSGKPKKIEIFVDSVRTQVVNSPDVSPIILYEDTRNWADGRHILKAVGYFSSTVEYSIPITFDNSPPEISISTPSEGEVLSGIRDFRFIIADSPDGRVKSVDIYIDGVFQGSLFSPSTPPNIYSFSVDTRNWAEGNHTLKVEALDIIDNKSLKSVNVIFDNTNPSALFVKPTTQYVRGIVELEVSASDNIGVKKVEFFFTGRICDAFSQICSITSPPYSINWDTSSVLFASTPISAVVEDKAGLSSITQITLVVDNVSPTVSIPSPPQYVKGIQSISISASDPTSITSVALFVDGSLVSAQSTSGSSVSIPLTLDTTLFTDGIKTVSAKAWDVAGNEGTFSVNITFDNTPPLVSLTYPPLGSFWSPLIISSIPITATLSDVNPKEVEFFFEGGSIGIDSSSPYTVNLAISSLPNFVYSVSVVGRDLAGNESSSSVTIVVDRTSPTPVSFLNPLSGDVVSGTIQIRTFGQDNFSLSRIDIFVDSSPVQTCSFSSTSGTCVKNYSTTGDRDLTLAANIYDKAGNQSITQIVVSVNNLSPLVSITSPVQTFLTCPTSTVLGFTGSDGSGITSAVLILKDLTTSAQTTITFNYSSPYPTQITEFYIPSNADCGGDGAKELRVIVYDRFGRSSSSSKNFTVDNTPPGLTIVFPGTGACISDSPTGSTKVVVSSCDSIFLKSISLYVSGNLKSTLSPNQAVSCSSPQTYTFGWQSITVSGSGGNSFNVPISVVAVDIVGNLKSQSVSVDIDNSAPVVSFVSPTSGADISSPVNVNLTFGDGGCGNSNTKKVSYQISLSSPISYLSSTQSCSLGSVPCEDTFTTSPNTFLWQATQYCGFFRLKAIGYDSVMNSSSTEIIIKIQGIGCPIPKPWSPPGGIIGAIRTTPILDFINNDGNPDIIFGTDGGRLYGISSLDGSFVGFLPFSTGGIIRASPIRAFVSGATHFIVGSTDKRIYVLRRDGTQFSNYLTSTAIYSTAATVFSDAVSSVVLVGDIGGRVGVYEVNPSGIFLRNCIPYGTPLDCGLNSVPIEDINSDGKPDIVNPIAFVSFLGANYVVVAASDGYLTLINFSTGVKVWAKYLDGGVPRTPPIVVDVDGDGVPDRIFVGASNRKIYCFDFAGGVCPGSWPIGNFTSEIVGISVVEIDSFCFGSSTPEPEIIVSAGISIYVLRIDGSQIASYNLGEGVATSSAIADLQGDGCPEIFVGSSQGKLFGFYFSGGFLKPLTGTPTYTGGRISLTDPVICDVDKNGRMDVVIGNESGMLQVYDIGPGTAGSGRIKWIPGSSLCYPPPSPSSPTFCFSRWDTKSTCDFP